MPELTVKALSEFATKTVHDQTRILAEQKRPAAGAAGFKTHYYQPTRLAVRAFFGKQTNQAALTLAENKLKTGSYPDHKRDNNLRAITQFRTLITKNQLSLISQKPSTYEISVHDVDVRLHPDLQAKQGSSTKYILINYNQTAVEDEFARRTIELMYWLLSKQGQALSIQDCEFWDLQTCKIHTNSKSPRQTTIKNAEKNLQYINQLWPII